MNKRFLIILAVCVAVFFGLIIFNKKDADAPDNSKQASSSSHTAGSGEVTLVEYGDFQCPACGGYYPIVKQVQEKYGDSLQFQFRNFPLVNIHPNAMSAHRAAEAAAKQDKFWEMHDLLYERQDAWSRSNNAASIFESYAKELGLNIDQYKKDLASPDVQAVINADMKAGQDLKVDSTPTFVLDGKKIDDNPRDLDGFVKLIDAELTAKRANKEQ